MSDLFLIFYQVDDTDVISFLLYTEIIPLCLRTMEMGSELSKTVEFLEAFGNIICRHLLFYMLSWLVLWTKKSLDFPFKHCWLPFAFED